ncbi:Vacuolar protein sorting-associated protein 9a [Cladophialophora carrionii]|uniref:Vacuolar protein sorting-associated protein 9a n=1 Tax=Cladophialophora carrionii TaxID=86049 RepID=A0A1C1CSZ9_9EURO|nr:Vacuolar protein sorting-associated protein 9a [Cladophialophora carrionii]
MDTEQKTVPTEIPEPNLIDLDPDTDTGGVVRTDDSSGDVLSERASEPGTGAAEKIHRLEINDPTADSNHGPSPKLLPSTPPPPEPPAASEKPYLDPTPKTPAISRHASVRLSEEEYNEKDPAYTPETEDNNAELPDQKPGNDPDVESTSEIQSIMDQFDDETAAPSKESIMSPRHEMTGPILGSTSGFPPRRSSLEHLRSRELDTVASPVISHHSEKPLPSPPQDALNHESGPLRSPPLKAPGQASTTSLPAQPPPPEPEPELPFDFHRFLEQLRHKSADPVAKFLRSFLTEFGKKQWMVHEQVKIIGDFLAFITNKMALCDVWREVSDNEFDNAKEGMEKLVMNRLYSQTFSPAIPPPPQLGRSRSRGRRKELEKSSVPGRRGQHQEDVERDDILAQKIRIYSWVREEHLDIAPVGPNGERFLKLAQQELLKIKGYRAPRDKVICVLNCCKVIFGLLKNSKSSDTSADSFVPLLIYVVLQANPENMVSNVQYILRFRNQEKLVGEAGYYLSSLSGAIQFIEGLDRTTLTVSDEEFERNVENAVAEIAEQNRQNEQLSPIAGFAEKSSVAEPELTPRNSMDVTSRSPIRRDPNRHNTSSGDGSDDSVAGLLRTIQRPLSTIGRIFSDQDTSSQERRPSPNPAPRAPPRLSPSVFQPPPSQAQAGAVPSYDAQEAAARQASAEAAEARRISRVEHRTVVDTLCGMFPNLDKEVIDDVVRQKEGRVGLAVDACLALTAGG